MWLGGRANRTDHALHRGRQTWASTLPEACDGCSRREWSMWALLPSWQRRRRRPPVAGPTAIRGSPSGIEGVAPVGTSGAAAAFDDVLPAAAAIARTVSAPHRFLNKHRPSERVLPAGDAAAVAHQTLREQHRNRGQDDHEHRHRIHLGSRCWAAGTGCRSRAAASRWAPAVNSVTTTSSNDSANASSPPATSAVAMFGQHDVAEGQPAVGAEVHRRLLERRARAAAAGRSRC